MSTPIDEKTARKLRMCPRCKRQSVRIKVDLGLDIDVKWAHRLTKKNLRDRGVRFDGAGWPTATRYCAGEDGSGRTWWCGWTEDGA